MTDKKREHIQEVVINVPAGTICPRCGLEIKEDEQCYRLSYGYWEDAVFKTDEDVEIWHKDCDQKANCEDPTATHRKCVHFIDTKDSTYQGEKVSDDTFGICYQGGYSEFGDSSLDEPLCQQEGGWCTAYMERKPLKDGSKLHERIMETLPEELKKDYLGSPLAKALSGEQQSFVAEILVKTPKKITQIDITEEEEQKLWTGEYKLEEDLNIVSRLVINHDGNGNVNFPASYTFVQCDCDAFHDILEKQLSEDYVMWVDVSDLREFFRWLDETGASI